MYGKCLTAFFAMLFQNEMWDTERSLSIAVCVVTCLPDNANLLYPTTISLINSFRLPRIMSSSCSVLIIDATLKLSLKICSFYNIMMIYSQKYLDFYKGQW